MCHLFVQMPLLETETKTEHETAKTEKAEKDQPLGREFHW
jgi:hypothetical protein